MESKLKKAEDELKQIKDEQERIQDSEALQNDVMDTRILKIQQEKDIVTQRVDQLLEELKGSNQRNEEL